MTSPFEPLSFLYTSKVRKKLHREGKIQKLIRQEADERNQDKMAIAADIWYLLHKFSGQYDLSDFINKSVTLAVEHAAANNRYDKTWDMYNNKKT